MSFKKDIRRFWQETKKYLATWRKLLRHPVDFAVLPESQQSRYVQPRTFLAITLALSSFPALVTWFLRKNGAPLVTVGYSALGVYMVLGLFALLSRLALWILGKPKRGLRPSLFRVWRAFAYVYAGPVWLFELAVILLLVVVGAVWWLLHPSAVGILVGSLVLALLLVPVFYSVAVLRRFYCIIWLPDDAGKLRRFLDWLAVSFLQCIICLAPILAAGAYAKTVSITKLTDVEREVHRRVQSLSQLERWHLQKFGHCATPVALKSAIQGVSTPQLLILAHYLDMTALSLDRDSLGYHFDVEEDEGRCFIHATPSRYSSDTRRSFFAAVQRLPPIADGQDLLVLAGASNRTFSADHQGGRATVFDPLVIDWGEQIANLFGRTLFRPNVKTSFGTLFIADESEFQGLFDFVATSIEGQIPRVYGAESTLNESLAAGGRGATIQELRRLSEDLVTELTALERRVNDLERLVQFGRKLGYVTDEHLEDVAVYRAIFEFYEEDVLSLVESARAK